jgi:hypothetical protein
MAAQRSDRSLLAGEAATLLSVFGRFVNVLRSDAMAAPPVLKRAETDNGIVTG